MISIDQSSWNSPVGHDSRMAIDDQKKWLEYLLGIKTISLITWTVGNVNLKKKYLFLSKRTWKKKNNVMASQGRRLQSIDAPYRVMAGPTSFAYYTDSLSLLVAHTTPVFLRLSSLFFIQFPFLQLSARLACVQRSNYNHYFSPSKVCDEANITVGAFEPD